MGQNNQIKALSSEAEELYKRGKHKKALKLYLELEELEAREPRWSRRLGDIYRKLNKTDDAVSAFVRAVDRYLRAGFLVKAIATCRLVLQLDPEHLEIQKRLASLNEERGFPASTKPRVPQGGFGTSRHGDEPTLGSVVAAQDRDADDSSIFELSLDDEDIVEMLEEGEDAQSKLQTMQLFGELDPVAISTIVQHSQFIEMAHKQILFRQGDPGDSLYVVIEGEVVVVNDGPPQVELARLGEGEFLGEVSLLTNEPRTASVVAWGDASLLAIPSSLLLGLANENPHVLQTLLRFLRARMTARLMTCNPLFEQFPVEQRGELISSFRCIDAMPDTVLVEEGEEADKSGLFVVLCGTVRVSRHKGEVTVATLGSGEIFGEISLIENTPATATVTSDGRSLLLEMPAQTFRETVMMHPQVLMYISQLAQERRAELLSVDNISLV